MLSEDAAGVGILDEAWVGALETAWGVAAPLGVATFEVEVIGGVGGFEAAGG